MYTTELLNVLHVVGRLVALESRHADLLSHICDGRMMSADVLRTNGAFDASATVRYEGPNKRQGNLLNEGEHVSS